MQKIGFVGLGHMGKPMAINLIKSGYQMVVYDVRVEPVKELAALGASSSESVQEIGATCDIVMTSLPHPKISEEVWVGPQGILSEAKPNSIFVELSTVPPALVQRIAQLAVSKSIAVLDAAVAGGVTRAAKGTLTIMVGGEKEAFQKIESIFRIIGKNVFHVGKVGSGMVVKLVNNAMAHVNVIAIIEGMAMGVKAGVTPQMLYEVISKSSGDSYQFRDRLGGRILKGNFEPGMRLALVHKDSVLACELGRELGVPLFVTSAAHSVYEWAKLQGLDEKDYGAIMTLWENLLKIRVRE